MWVVFVCECVRACGLYSRSPAETFFSEGSVPCAFLSMFRVGVVSAAAVVAVPCLFWLMKSVRQYGRVDVRCPKSSWLNSMR